MCIKYGFCHTISWYELFKLSSFERLMKGNYFMCASSDVRNFQSFLSISFSIKIMKTTCWCDWLWCLISTAHLFARTSLGFCHRGQIYAPFCVRISIWLMHLFWARQNALLRATRLDSDRQSERTLTPRTFMTGRRPRNRFLHLNFSKILILGKGKLWVLSSLGGLLISDVCGIRDISWSENLFMSDS